MNLIRTAAEKIQQMLAPVHTSVRPEDIGNFPVDEMGNPIGSTSARNHKVAETARRARLFAALKAKAQLDAEDRTLARQLGINVGPDEKDPTQFDL